MPPGGPHGQPPFGQAPYGQQHPYGQYSYGQYSYGQWPYGQAPTSQPGGFGGPPVAAKRKRSTGLWFAIALPALALAAFLVAGLALPGFLVSNGGGSWTKGGGKGMGGPRQVATALVDGVNDRNKGALHDLTCSGADGELDPNIENVNELRDAKLQVLKKVSDEKVVARMTISVANTRVIVHSDIRKENSHWCWQDWNAAGELADI